MTDVKRLANDLWRVCTSQKKPGEEIRLDMMNIGMEVAPTPTPVSKPRPTSLGLPLFLVTTSQETKEHPSPRRTQAVLCNFVIEAEAVRQPASRSDWILGLCQFAAL